MRVSLTSSNSRGYRTDEPSLSSPSPHVFGRSDEVKEHLLWLRGWLSLARSPSFPLPLPPFLSRHHRRLRQPKTDVLPTFTPPTNLGQVVKVEISLVVSACEHGLQQPSHGRLAGGASVDHGPEQRHIRGRDESRAGGAFTISSRPANLNKARGDCTKWLGCVNGVADRVCGKNGRGELRGVGGNRMRTL